MTTRKPSNKPATKPVTKPTTKPTRPTIPPAPPEPFAFTMSNSRTQISEQTLLDGLRKFADHRARIGARSSHANLPFTAAEFNAWPHRPAAAVTYYNRFGAWNKALARAGIQTAPYRYSPEQLMDTLEKCWRAAGRTPGKAALKRYGGITAIPYVNRWGSLRRACSRLARFHAGHITREELLTPDAAPKRKPLPPSLRWQIIQRDNYHCTACGSPAHKGNRLEVDHIHPVSQGGTNDPTNLRTLCQRCNQGRGDNRRKSAA